MLVPLATAAPLMTAVEVHPIRTFRIAPGRGADLESMIDRVGRFLPANYLALGDPDGVHVLVAGFDHAGWTRDDYVLPRLASGWIFPTEPGDTERRYDIVLNLFHEGYRAIADDLETDDYPTDAFQGRLDCIAFVMSHYSLLAQLDLSQAFHHGADFYLTRNGHGTGFWDRGYGDIGTQLTEAAKVYGSTC